MEAFPAIGSDVIVPLKALFMLYLARNNSLFGPTNSGCHLQNMYSQKFTVFRYIFLVALIFFAYISVDTASKFDFGWYIPVAMLVLLWYVMTLRMGRWSWLLTMILLCVTAGLRVYVEWHDRRIADTLASKQAKLLDLIKKQQDTQEVDTAIAELETRKKTVRVQLTTISNYLLLAAGIVTFVGFTMFAGEKLIEYGKDFSWSTLIDGTTSCKLGDPFTVYASSPDISGNTSALAKLFAQVMHKVSKSLRHLGAGLMAYVRPVAYLVGGETWFNDMLGNWFLPLHVRLANTTGTAAAKAWHRTKQPFADTQGVNAWLAQRPALVLLSDDGVKKWAWDAHWKSVVANVKAQDTNGDALRSLMTEHGQALFTAAGPDTFNQLDDVAKRGALDQLATDIQRVGIERPVLAQGYKDFTAQLTDPNMVDTWQGTPEALLAYIRQNPKSLATDMDSKLAQVMAAAATAARAADTMPTTTNNASA